MIKRTMMQAKEVTSGTSMRWLSGMWVAGVAVVSLMASPSAEYVETVAHLEQAGRTDRHRQRPHHTLEQRLPQRIEIEHEQQVADGEEGQRAEDRAYRAAAPAEQRHAAQHHRRDGVERIAARRRLVCLARRCHEGKVEPAEAGEQA